MFNVIRNSLMAENGVTLSGEVEMDETYLNPKRRLSQPVGQSGRSLRERVVMGAVERQGQVVARYVGSANRLEVENIVGVHVLPATMVYTDESPIYKRLTARGYGHARVNHSAGIYVDGAAHTQSIEGFWSLLKSGIRGTYHSVSTKWLAVLPERVHLALQPPRGHPPSARRRTGCPSGRRSSAYFSGGRLARRPDTFLGGGGALRSRSRFRSNSSLVGVGIGVPFGVSC